MFTHSSIRKKNESVRHILKNRYITFFRHCRKHSFLHYESLQSQIGSKNQCSDTTTINWLAFEQKKNAHHFFCNHIHNFQKRSLVLTNILARSRIWFSYGIHLPERLNIHSSRFYSFFVISSHLFRFCTICVNTSVSQFEKTVLFGYPTLFLCIVRIKFAMDMAKKKNQHQSAVYEKSLKYACSSVVKIRGLFGGVN